MTPEKTAPRETSSREQGPGGQFGMFLFGLIVLWSLVWFGVSRGLEMKFQTLWTSDSGKPISLYFAFIGFPRSGSVKVYDAEAGTEVGELNRAVKMSVAEEASEWVGLMGVPRLYVRRSDLTLEPPRDCERLLGKYRHEMSARMGLEFMGADVFIGGGTGTSTTVTFEQGWDDSRERSTYSIEGGRGHALAYSRATAGGVLMDTGCLLVPVWIVCGMFGTRFLWRRLRQSRAMPAQ